jgi:HTH-type transcriptional regulator/antitoxin HigA
LAPRDLIPFVGSRNRVYEVLNHKRPLTLKMVWRLHTGLGIPAESLIKQQRDRAA